jgi:hypothetical protein
VVPPSPARSHLIQLFTDGWRTKRSLARPIVKLNRLRFEGCLRWLSPFGLLELSQPYAANRWTPVVVLAGCGGGDAGRDSWSPPRRDLHGGLLTQAVGRAPRRALLGSVSAFALRRTLRPLAGWSVAIGALPADRVDGRLDDRLPGREPPLGRPGRAGGVRRAGLGARARREPVHAAGRAGRGVHGGTAGRVRRRRDRPALDPAVRPAAQPPTGRSRPRRPPRPAERCSSPWWRR